MFRLTIYSAFAIVALLATADIYRMSLEIKENLLTNPTYDLRNQTGNR